MTKVKVKGKTGMGKQTVCAYCRKFDTCYIHGRRYLCDLCGLAEDGAPPTIGTATP